MSLRVLSNYTRGFWLFLIAITVVRLFIALFLGPAPQETYYWNYSKHLDLSYFDHPPMTAYLIYLFTSIFGDNAFGIHFSAVFISVILAIALFYFVNALFDERMAFWAVVVSSTTFIFALGSLIITPDAPLLLFWILMMISLYQSIRSGRNLWWILTGVFLGAAFVSKYTAVFAIAGAFLYLVVSKQRRFFLKTVGPFLSLVAGLIVSLPVIIWNYQHDWASFGFQSGRRAAGLSLLRPDYFFGFIGSQVGITAIFLMPLFIWGIIKAVGKVKDDQNLALLFWFCIPTLTFFIAISPLTYVKMNWLAPAYLSGFPLALYFYFRSMRRSLKNYGIFALTFSVVVTVAVHFLALFPIFGIGRADTINGFKELSARVDEIKKDFEDREQLFICGYEYKTASQLRFYLEGQPETCSNNIVGERGLAYDYWSNPDTLIGWNCIFVYDERNRYKEPEKLSVFFEHVEGPEVLTVTRGGKKITDFHIYRCYKYRGL